MSAHNETKTENSALNDSLSHANELLAKSESVKDSPKDLERLSKLMDEAMKNGNLSELKKIQAEFHLSTSAKQTEWTLAQQKLMDKIAKAKGLKGARQSTDKKDISISIDAKI